MTLDIILTIFFVILNGFFVMAEFAIVKVRSTQIEVLQKKKSRLNKVAKKITHNLDEYLAATQLGITIASLSLGWFGEKVVALVVYKTLSLIDLSLPQAILDNSSYIFAFIFITFLHIVFGELIPKSLAIQSPLVSTLVVAYPLNIFYITFGPIIKFFNSIAQLFLKIFGVNFSQDTLDRINTPEELEYILTQGKDTGVIDNDDQILIKNALEFSDRVVKNILVPRTKIFALPVTIEKEELLKELQGSGYSRVPVFDTTIDKIIGILYTKDVLIKMLSNEDIVITELMKPPHFVHKNKKISMLLKEFQTKRIHMAIVRDEFGGTAGLITTEDIIEELVGEIEDEHDEKNLLFEKVSDSEYIVDGSISIHDINELISGSLPEDTDFETMSGLLIQIFDKFPDIGEKKKFNRYQFEILSKEDNNIKKIRIIEEAPTPESEDKDDVEENE